MDLLITGARVALALAAVLGLLVFLQRRITRGGKRERRTGPLEVVTRKGIGSKASVVLLDLDGTRFLLGVTEHSVSVLHSIPGDGATAPVPAAPAAAVPQPAPVSLPASGPDEFDLLVAAATAEQQDDDQQKAGQQGMDIAHPVDAVRLRPRTRTRSTANGSILSPETWRQTAAFLRQPR